MRDDRPRYKAKFKSENAEFPAIASLRFSGRALSA